ncbi:DUF3098 domain-containing protein [Flavobacterium akiainvivens]|uniref:DUF3098 domain-containing protein n=1 Tax=Flavobacterium akiainvivens TaxID=1202724 RepID=UPI0008EF8549|nr:DUF3098 domain-containing protein [Flavobacterium akiainvivens]SFQ71060.1 Protein of unknown function [Flavobacterium akiainvivens]
MSNNNLKSEFLFEKVNYKFLLIGIGVIALGFILMAGGGSDDPNVWNDAIFNFQRIRLAPALVLAGFGITIYAILKNPNKTETAGETFPEDQPIKTQPTKKK